MQGLDRIAAPIGGKHLLSVLWPLIDEWSKSGEWQRRHAALLSIAQVAEGCCNVLLQEQALKALVTTCCNAANDPHAVVKWCACQAIGQVCTGAHLCMALCCDCCAAMSLQAYMTQLQQAHCSSTATNTAHADLQPKIQKHHHGDIMAALIHLMRPEEEPRVQV